MDLLEIRKKAKNQKVKVSAPDAVAPVLSVPAPHKPEPAPRAEATTAAVSPPAKVKKAAVAEISPESFEAFLQSTAEQSKRVAEPPPLPAAPSDFSQMAQDFGREPAAKSQGLDALFLDLATEELYRHSYLADPKAEEIEQREVLSCMLATEQYGVDIHRIKEIIKMRDITEVPRAPSFILGIITLRGRVIPVFDLRIRLALEKAEFSRESKIVVVHHKDELYGLIVDAVIDVSRFPEASVEATPNVMVGVEAKYIEGIGRAGDQMIILLNLDEVLSLDAANAA